MNKSVLITGSYAGTGLAIADRFAKEGYDVFITNHRSPEKIDEAAAALQKKYPNVFIKGFLYPVCHEDGVKELFENIRATGRTLDCLVLNAANLGIAQDSFDVSEEDFTDVVYTNMIWNFLTVRNAAKMMREKGGGAIVFINSNTAYRAIPSRVAYSASKGGALGMMRALALDYGPYNIRVNAVLPGMIKTVRWETNYNDCRHALSRYTPLGDIADFEDIANAAWFLGSDQSRNVTGAEITVDGGNTIQLYPTFPSSVHITFDE